MSNGKKSTQKRPPKNAPAKPPSVPKPSEVSAPAKAKAPAPKRAGKRPPDPKARAERRQRQRWVLALVGLVVLLVVLVIANAWLMQRQGVTPAGTATSVATQSTAGAPADAAGTVTPAAEVTATP